MSESAKPRTLAAAAFALLAVAAIYGLHHEHLPAQPLWSPGGQSRFLEFVAVYWIAAGILLLAMPRWFGAVAAVFALVYTAWWVGPAAPLAVLYFFGACLLTGSILSRQSDSATATLLGLSAAIFVIWIALHFRVNYRGVYAAVLALPYLWETRRWRDYAARFRFRCDSRTQAAALALLLFVLMAHWLVAMNPEASDDGLAMHLAAPLAVLHEGRWAFDFHQYTWALIPAGGECLYTAAVLLGSHVNVDAAPKLANFALLAIMVILIVQTSRRWLSLERSFLVAALFISTPVVQLVTGSLFVENVWAAMILGSSIAVLRFVEKEQVRDLYIASALVGTALAVKLIAALFLVPIGIVAGWIALRKRQFLPLAAAALAATVAALPPYLYAFIKTGNPAYPWLNTTFHSPYFDSLQPFIDGRFLAPLSWLTPYLITFRSGAYIEGQGGAGGFQYFLLLIPAAILAVAARHRLSLLLLSIASLPVLALLIFVPNLRYSYPAMPLFSIALGMLLTRFAGAAPLFVLITALNCWFLPSSGWYQKDFAFFTRSEAEHYRAAAAPERVFEERLNREAPGQPVALFDSDFVAGFEGKAYTNSWHTYAFWQRIVQAKNAKEIAGILQEAGIRNVIAPASRKSNNAAVDAFLRQRLEQEGEPLGRMALFHLHEGYTTPSGKLEVLPPGEWDDVDDRVEYTGDWLHGREFDGAVAGSVTYSGQPGDSFRLAFSGSGITYVFTKAFNRGMAEVSIDGMPRGRIDLYSPKIEWQTKQVFNGLKPGIHVFEVRILKGTNAPKKENFVDLDEVVVAP